MNVTEEIFMLKQAVRQLNAEVAKLKNEIKAAQPSHALNQYEDQCYEMLTNRKKSNKK